MTKEQEEKIDWAYKAIGPFIDNLGDIFSKEMLVYNMVKRVMFDKAALLSPTDSDQFPGSLGLVCDAFAKSIENMPTEMEEYLVRGMKAAGKGGCNCILCILTKAATEVEAAKGAGKTETEQAKN